MRPGSGIALGLVLWSSGCTQTEPSPSDPVVRQARFGVFLGGQVQEREEIPFQLDRARQIQGLRIDFHRPLEKPQSINWEIDMPGYTKRVRDKYGRLGRGRVTRLGARTVPQGSERFEWPLRLQPGDPLGLWNVRVQIEQRLILDQRFYLYDAHRRRRQHPDAGR